MSTLTYRHQIDGASARASFMHVCFPLRQVQSEVCHRLMPAPRMISHRIEKHTVHIEHGRPQRHPLKSSRFQIPSDRRLNLSLFHLSMLNPKLLALISQLFLYLLHLFLREAFGQFLPDFGLQTNLLADLFSRYS